MRKPCLGSGKCSSARLTASLGVPPRVFPPPPPGPIFAAIRGPAAPPRFRRRRNGFATLLHIILEQQVSIDAAAKMYHRLVGLCRPLAPATFLALDDATLRL